MKDSYFTDYEVELLTQLVEPRKGIIESKRNDKVVKVKKEEAWQQLANEFNADPKSVFRTVDRLKKKWFNMKQECKKQVVKEKNERRKTGGGVVETVACDNENRIASIIAENLISLDNKFDSDAIEVIEEQTNDQNFGQEFKDINEVTDAIERKDVIEGKVKADEGEVKLLDYWTPPKKKAKISPSNVKFEAAEALVNTCQLERKHLEVCIENESLKQEVLLKMNKYLDNLIALQPQIIESHAILNAVLKVTDDDQGLE